MRKYKTDIREAFCCSSMYEINYCPSGIKNLDKRKRKGLVILILGLIIILITIGVMVFIFAPIGSWGYGLAQTAFYFFIGIGAIIALIGLVYLIVRKDQDK